MHAVSLLCVALFLGAATSGCHAPVAPTDATWAEGIDIHAEFIRNDMPGAGSDAYVIVQIVRDANATDEEIMLERIEATYGNETWAGEPESRSKRDPDSWAVRGAPRWPGDAQVSISAWLTQGGSAPVHRQTQAHVQVVS